jgi:hypothetical protein
MNDHSSRSHAVVSITLTGSNADNTRVIGMLLMNAMRLVLNARDERPALFIFVIVYW